MTNCPSARRGRFLLLLAAPALLAGCMSVETPEVSRGAGQPRLATYSCGEDGSLRIESAGGMVRLTHIAPRDPRAAGDEVAAPEPVELPAAPPGQATRFGKDGYALVIEGREALYMKAGRVPLTCTR